MLVTYKMEFSINQNYQESVSIIAHYRILSSLALIKITKSPYLQFSNYEHFDCLALIKITKSPYPVLIALPIILEVA